MLHKRQFFQILYEKQGWFLLKKSELLNNTYFDKFLLK
ncbi:Putative protein [Zobellia galactanivorans]|uniref:Uncharacterized protein n=1 Tax=Zobellia galactanivorans (strain DSM 12802 / CCUG 47099 / CIP 106680 / NCIMB 13871 / Dsij) TaxID=63186 RepID=G0LC51_ZOBGA|nr:Putative protein [Zobellia galactanivorans]